MFYTYKKQLLGKICFDVWDLGDLEIDELARVKRNIKISMN